MTRLILLHLQRTDLLVITHLNRLRIILLHCSELLGLVASKHRRCDLLGHLRFELVKIFVGEVTPIRKWHVIGTVICVAWHVE